jgi:hypothetical protein
LPRDWHDCLESIERWILEDVAIAVRVLRLRSCLYLKIPWIETSNMVRYMRFHHLVCDVSEERSWLTIPEYLNDSGQLIDEVKDEFELRKLVYDDWNEKSQSLGLYAEDLVRRAFADAGYSVRKRIFELIPNLVNDGIGRVEIDAYCVNDSFRLGVQVKNVTSEVFIDPNKIRRPTEIYLELIRQFDYCSRNGIVPILISSFIEGSFYCFVDQHGGLHCQTYLQLFNPENETLCTEIKEILGFGNVRVVNELPPNVTRWIDNIPSMHMKRERLRGIRQFRD